MYKKAFLFIKCYWLIVNDDDDDYDEYIRLMTYRKFSLLYLMCVCMWKTHSPRSMYKIQLPYMILSFAQGYYCNLKRRFNIYTNKKRPFLE